MRILKLSLENFGPFSKYEIDFTDHLDDTCILITGKNNEGKSNLIFALKLIHAGLKVIGKKRQEIFINSQKVYKLYIQDTEKLLIKSLTYNYNDEIAEIKATFRQNLNITVFVDPIEEIIYCDYDGIIPDDVESIFGFIPYLGMLAPREEFIENTAHLRTSLTTSLAPHHLRNHLVQLLSAEEYEIIQNIIRNSWNSIELLDYRVVEMDRNRIDCFYEENRYEREIAWAGQGLQVWFQIITHLVRLLNTKILILDEPEINLHPEKQNDLINIIRQYYSGSIIIATHSMELMNNVNVSHIINVKKSQSKPKIKSTDDRKYLEIVRSQIGSNFNFISSQFENVDYILFTEDLEDFKIIQKLAEISNIKYSIFNVPIHGFSEFKKAIYYRDAYRVLIGHPVKYKLILDKDYYPDDYLNEIKTKLSSFDIKVIYTPGKEIENLLINPNILEHLFSLKNREKFRSFFNDLFTEEEKHDSYGSFIKLHEEFLPKKMDTKTIIKNFSGIFNHRWSNVNERYNYISGKNALKAIRQYYKDLEGESLSNILIFNMLLDKRDSTTRKFVNEIFS